MHLRRNGKVYEVSPWLLTWDDENYYLIAYDSEAGIIKHYRVDKMLKIELSVEKREGKEQFQHFDIAAYSKKHLECLQEKRRLSHCDATVL
mgnify:CR=1 FL=1